MTKIRIEFVGNAGNNYKNKMMTSVQNVFKTKINSKVNLTLITLKGQKIKNMTKIALKI